MLGVLLNVVFVVGLVIQIALLVVTRLASAALLSVVSAYVLD